MGNFNKNNYPSMPRTPRNDGGNAVFTRSSLGRIVSTTMKVTGLALGLIYVFNAYNDFTSGNNSSDNSNNKNNKDKNGRY